MDMDRVIGSVIIVVGLYSVLWGKYKEEKEEKRKREVEEVITEAVKADINGNEESVKNEVAVNLPLSTIKPLHQV